MLKYGRLRKRLAAQLCLISRTAAAGTLTGVWARIALVALRWTLHLIGKFRPAMVSAFAIGSPLGVLPDRASAQAEFRLRTGAANPLTGIDLFLVPSPFLADVDDDGDFDLVVGDYFGDLTYLENTAPENAPPRFQFRPGDANPFETINVGDFSAPTFADLDNDGDLDAIVGESRSEDAVNYFRNDGNNRAPFLQEQTGVSSPVDGLEMPGIPMPVLVDLDGDRDADLVLGTDIGDFRYFQNTGSFLTPSFSERRGILNPFNNLSVQSGLSTPAFADLDRDGDFDLVSGEYNGQISYFENTGSARLPRFAPRAGTENPFDQIDVGLLSDPTLADLDGDGDADLVVGEGYYDGLLRYYENIDPGPVSGFPQWQRLNFTFPGEASLAVPEADPDNDGRSNLVEFGLRTGPRRATFVPVISPIINTNGVLSYTIAIRDDPALVVVAEFSNSPSFEDAIEVFPVINDPVPGDLVKTATFIDIIGSAGERERYMRLVFRLL